ncbi:MAG: nucleotidyltransferase substrate binding protein [Hydrogenoanaerobacterium sp.]
MQKIENFTNAVSQLLQAAKIYGSSPEDELYRDGLIQRFEFTVELAWKSLKEYLEDQGTVLAVTTPRAVLKEAYAAGIIFNEIEWNAILTARNLTSHVYDEATAKKISSQICNDFLPVLCSLANFYQQ